MIWLAMLLSGVKIGINGIFTLCRRWTIHRGQKPALKKFLVEGIGLAGIAVYVFTIEVVILQMLRLGRMCRAFDWL